MRSFIFFLSFISCLQGTHRDRKNRTGQQDAGYGAKLEGKNNEQGQASINEE